MKALCYWKEEEEEERRRIREKTTKDHCYCYYLSMVNDVYSWKQDITVQYFMNKVGNWAFAVCTPWIIHNQAIDNPSHADGFIVLS